MTSRRTTPPSATTPGSPSWVDRRRVEAALADSAAFGPYFATRHEPAGVPLHPQELYEPPTLQRLLSVVGQQIGTSESRVAASTVQYGLAARCWSLVLGVWQCGGMVLDLRGLVYVVSPTGSVNLSLAEVRARDCAASTDDEVAGLITDMVIAHQLAGMHSALREVVRVADGLLWGNAASALVSAVRPIIASHPSEQLTAVTTAIMSRPPLAGRLGRSSEGGTRRLSCCLWYRTRHRETCGDCPLTRRPILDHPLAARRD